MFRYFLFTLVGLLFLAGAGPLLAQETARYEAMLASGVRITGEKITGRINDPKSLKLGEQLLLEAARPMRWIHDRRAAPPRRPDAYLETWTGDIMPGEAIGCYFGGVSPYEPLPAHWMVRPAIRLRPPEKSADENIKVVDRYVRRVVWRRRVRNYRAGTVFYRDGRRLAFRAVRLGGESVTVLTSEGTRRIAFREMDELHMPAKDVWRAYFDELAVLSPHAQSRLMQFETSAGLLATASQSRIVDRSGDEEAENLRLAYGVQPAWSLDILWIPASDIWMRRSFAPQEIPLSRIAPVESQQRSLLGGAGSPVRVNRNVRGGPLRGNKGRYGWGLGVHAFSQLRFSLPRGARSFQGVVGLDRAAGEGGCIRARVFIGDDSSEPIFETLPLVGGGETTAVGPLVLSGFEDGDCELILQIDPAHEDRPAGADPLDIRDLADWLDIRVDLDLPWLQAELRQRALSPMYAWSGWTIENQTPAGAEAPLYWTDYYDPTSDWPGVFRRGVVAEKGLLRLTRCKVLGPGDQWLVAAVHRHQDGLKPPKIEVRIDGRAVVEHEAALMDEGHPDAAPLIVSLAAYQNEAAEVKIEIVQHSQAESAPLTWRALHIGEQLPWTFGLFEDHGEFQAVDPNTDGAAALTEEDPHSGKAAVKITPAGQFRLSLKQPLAIARTPRWGQYRFLRFAFRKVGGGRFSIELNRPLLEDGRIAEPALRYDAGVGEPVFGASKRIWLKNLSDQWVVVTRDLFSDFGQSASDASGKFHIDGVTLSTPDGEFVLLDHIYLARNVQDFEALETP